MTTKPEVDMSSAAVTSRLELLRALYKLSLSLVAAGREKPVEKQR